MPEESKGTEPVSPTPAGQANAPKPEVQAKPQPPSQSAAPQTNAGEKAEPVKPAAPAAKPASAAPAKPAAPAAAAGAPGAKPAAATPAKPAAPAKPAGPVPEPWDADLTRSLKKQYGSGIKEASTYVGQKYLVVASEIVREVLFRMRDEEGYDYCVDITAVHYPKREQQFDVVYVLYSFHHNQRVRVKTQIAEGQHVHSAVDIWPAANWLEREVYDMFGIVFDGHPDLKRILMPDEWKGHPLRKDYDILQQDKEWVQINLGIESGQ